MKKLVTGFVLLILLLFAAPQAAQAGTLAAPTLTSASTNVSSRVKLKWRKVSNAQAYRVYARKAGGSWTKLATVKNCYYKTKSLSPAKYAFKVRAVRKSGSKVVKGKLSRTVVRTVKAINGVPNRTDRSTIVSLAKKIGGMKAVSSSSYRSFCAKGNGISIGYNKYASYPDKYVLVKNTGNKAVKMYGLRLGMTRAQALRAATYESSDNGTTFGVWYASVNVKYNSKGRISSMYYQLCPTS